MLIEVFSVPKYLSKQMLSAHKIFWISQENTKSKNSFTFQPTRFTVRSAKAENLPKPLRFIQTVPIRQARRRRIYSRFPTSTLFKMPVIVTRCSNNYGPFQFPEKLIPLMIINALNDKSLPVYGDGLNVRDWLFVDDHSMAIDEIFHNGKIGEVYNIGGNNEWRNIEIVKFILNEIGKPESLITFVKDRPGHDKRYAMDATKLKNELGWEPKTTFENGLPKTIKWYLENKNWWENVTSGEYQKYYETQYVKRIKI